MQSAVITIKTAYEKTGMTPEQIAEDQNLELATVKAALMQSSSQYRKACGQEEEDENKLNFSKEQLRQVNNVLFQMAVESDDEHVKFKCCTYIRDDFKGRKETIRQIAGNNTFNILNFNEQIHRARASVEALKAKLIEV